MKEWLQNLNRKECGIDGLNVSNSVITELTFNVSKSAVAE